MKNTMKRMLCLLLALVMCAGLALGAAADETSTITLNENQLELYVGDSALLEAMTDYTETVSWHSNNENVATVDNGYVEALSRGVTTITATAGSATASCTVTVSNVEISSFEVSAVSGADIVPDDKNVPTITVPGKTSFTLKGTTEYRGKDPVDGARWIIRDESILSVSGNTFTTLKVGETIIEAYPPEEDGSSTHKRFIKVEVEDEPITRLSITGAGSNPKLDVGGTLTLGTSVTPSNAFEQPVTWSSSNPAVASVDGGVVTAKMAGSTTITAASGGKDASVTVTVNKPSPNISASATVGTRLTFSGIYDSLMSKFEGTYGSRPAASDKVKITSLGSGTVGTLCTSGGSTVSKNSTPELSAFKNYYLSPLTAGSYAFGYELTKGADTLKGTITITVTSTNAKADITIRLGSDSSAYSFDSDATLDDVSAASAIRTAISKASGANYDYIKFGSITSGNNVGTLYADSDNTTIKTTTPYNRTGTDPLISDLYFVPAKAGTYARIYAAYNSSGAELCSGSLIIEVDADDATVTVTLDDDSGYFFSEKTRKNNTSAAAAIDDAIYNENLKTYSYIMFGSVPSGSSSVGTLYADSDMTSIKTTTRYNRSASASDSVSDLYFVPKKAGSYVRSFTAYDSNNKKIFEGTLKIVVPSDSNVGIDLYFNTTTGGSVSLDEDVFEGWYRQQKGSSHKLAYVTFDEVSRSFGSFKHSGSSFTPGNNVKYFAEGFTGSTGSNPRYLDNVKYTAPSSTGYVSVDFTCYGGTTASVSSTKASGTLFLFVTGGSVKAVSLNAGYGSAATLSDGDFSTVHRNAMSLSSGASAKHYIQLLEVPSKGTLYYNYTSSSKTGTKLTSSNFDDYKFYVNSGSSYDSVDDLTYVPANSATGTVSVRYLARSTSGEPMYVGSINFNCVAGQSASVSCSPEGYTFKASDFYYSGDSDPVACVTFTQPDSGSLMLGFANGRGVYLSSSVRLYTVNSSRGSYPLTSLSYIPRAGFSGSVDIYYTAVTEGGKTQNGIFTIAVSGRKGSSHFKDVLSTGSGAWSADAIDFAYKWGLVNGTGTDTFSPDDTMTRAMLVTILYRSAGSPKVSGSCPFTDVAAGTYYYDAVIWAANNGIVTGTSPTTFSPDRNVNREQVAAFLHRYAKYNGKSVAVTGTLNGYVDKSFVSEYAIEPVSWAVQNGYITSNSGTELLLSPGGNATRAQVAVMLHRFLTY